MAKHKANPGGHSIIQRLEFWRTSLLIIEKNPWFGVGTGDIPSAYKNQYEEMDSKLQPQFRHRAHNQYLATFVTFGMVGVIWFIISLIYPAIALKKFRSYRYVVFWITIMLSMLVEDTLETQMGATLFAFFNAFLLFAFVDEPANKASDYKQQIE
jgi:O-antigen ligase